MFKVFVAEDEPKILRNLIQKINGLGMDFIVIGSAANGSDALTLVMELEPDVLITDIVMPKCDGLSLIEKTKAIYPELPVIVLSGYDEFEYARQAVRLGVKDYLLKPADEHALRETLDRIKESLQLRRREKNLDVLHSYINLDITRRLTTGEQDVSGQYALFLLCLGNLYEDITLLGTDLIILYQKTWRAITLKGMPLDSNQNLFLLDESFNNQKMLVIELGKDPLVSIPELAESLNRLLLPQTGGMPLTIIYSRKPVDLCDAYDLSMGLRRSLNERLVPCTSRLINLESTQLSMVKFESLLAESEKRIEIVGRNCGKKALEHELSKYVDECTRIGMPQRLFVRLFKSIFRFSGMRNQGTPASSEILDRQLDGVLNRYHEPNALRKELIRLLDEQVACLDFPLTPEKTADLLEEYLLEHYTEPITMERICEKFGFELSYLTQLYKRNKGITPNKRLINLRIDKARELLELHHDLSIKVIAQIVGYPDQRYFSRIFRKYTGFSPLEHRANTRKSTSV